MVQVESQPVARSSVENAERLHRPVGSTIKLTAGQYLQLGDDPPGVRLELVDGGIAASPNATPLHAYAAGQLTTLLTLYVMDHSLGQVLPKVDVLIDDYNVRRPDIAYFAKARLHLVGDKAMEGPPDLCVEVLSPSSATIDRRDKFEQYAAAGVAHYWIIDPDQRTAEGFTLQANQYQPTGRGRDEDILRFPPFPDLDIPLAKLWRPR